MKAARKFFARSSYEQCIDFEFIKSELISIARSSPKAYLAKFRSTARTGNESQKKFVGKLAGALDYWLQALSITKFDELKQIVLLKQFLNMLNASTRQFVETRGVRSAHQVVEAADLYYETTMPKKTALRSPETS